MPSKKRHLFKMEFQPLVSIIIPVYNGSNFVKEAIDSALNQTYKNIEIIVVNDGSRDDGATEQIALSYGDKIRYIYKENGGVSTALNTGIANMQGEYFSWLSHDDMYKPEKIEKQIEAINQYENRNALIYCKTEQINKDSICIREAKTNKRLKFGKNTYYEALSAMLPSGAFSGCALLVPKKAFDISGGFNESLKYSQDSLMWIKIFFNKFDLIYIDYTGVCSRVHAGQLTQRGREIFYKDSYIASKEVIPLIKEDKHRKVLMYLYAKYFAKMNCKDALCECLKESKKNKILSLGQRINIRFTALYGKIRPFIRRVYFRLFRRVKTN